jgi:shikimate kinase
MNTDIILIGPIGTGKTTIGKLLSEALHINQCSIDDCRWKYYNEIGYDENFAKFLREKGGFWALYMYWKEFECYAVERMLNEHSNCVFDFGGGHSVYEISTHFNKVEKVIKPYKNVFLLLPSEDVTESIEIINKRNNREPGGDDSVNIHFMTHPSNKKLAKHIIYTKEKTPDQIKCEILKKLDLVQ